MACMIQPQPAWVANVLAGTCTIDWNNDTIMFGLLADTYEYREEDTTWASVSSHEVVGEGYTSGGQVIDGIAVVEKEETIHIYGSNLVWQKSENGFSAAYGVLYHQSTGGILGIVDFCKQGTPVTRNNYEHDLILKWNNDGIFSAPKIEE